MKTARFSREGTLKSLLLLALVANISWQPIADQIEQMDFSSEGTDVTATEQTPGARTCDDPKKCEPLSKDAREKAAENSKNNREAFEAAKAAEEKKSGKAKTSADNDDSADEAKATCTSPKCLKTAAADAKVKGIQEQIAVLNESLNELIKGKTTSTNLSSEDEDEDVTTFRSISNAELQATCKEDADGDELSERAEFSCQLRRLAKLRGRDKAEERRDVTKRIEDLFTELRRDVRDDLLGANSQDRRRAESLVTEMLSALSKVKFDRESAREEMIDSLKSLKVGAKVMVVADELEDDVKELETDVKKSMREFTVSQKRYQNSCRSRNGCDGEAYDEMMDARDELSDLGDEYQDLAETLSEERSEAIDALSDYEDSISRSELRQYMTPFTKMAKRLQNLKNGKVNSNRRNGDFDGDSVASDESRYDGSGSGFLEEYDLPADFMEVRNSANSGLLRSNGNIDPNTFQRPMGSASQVAMQQQQSPYVPSYMQTGLGQPSVPGAIPATGAGGYQPYGMHPQNYGTTPINYGMQMPQPQGGSLLPPPQQSYRTY